MRRALRRRGIANGSLSPSLSQATYLAVPYLPVGSTFARDFVASLFPQQALAAGEIQWATLDEDLCEEAGLLPKPDPETGDVEWEWTERHSALLYVQLFQKEGLL